MVQFNSKIFTPHKSCAYDIVHPQISHIELHHKIKLNLLNEQHSKYPVKITTEQACQTE